jgi:hypothetical protein
VQRHTELLGDRDADLHPLVRNQRRNHQEVGAVLAGGGEEIDVHRRRDHLGIAAPVALDAARDEARVGDEVVHARGRDHVPGAQVLELAPQ